MSTQPQDQPDELQKAIERLENEVAIAGDGDQFSRDITTACNAAKQLRQVEKERDELKEQRTAIWGDLGIRTQERDQLKLDIAEIRRQHNQEISELKEGG